MRNLFILSTLALLMHPLSLSAQNSFSLSLDVNSATGDQAVTSLNTSPDQVVAIQIFGKDIQNATGVSVRFEYDAGQVTYEGFDTGTVLPNANALTEQGTNPTFVKIGVVSFGGQATVNEGLIGTIRFRTLAAFSGSAIRLVRGELARGGQIESRALDLRVALQKLPTSFSLFLDVNDSVGDQGVTSAIVSANEGVAVQVFGDDMEGANSLVARFEYDAAQVSYEGFDAGTVLPNAQVTHQQGSSFVEVSITSSGQATANSGLVGTIRFRTSATFSGSAIRLARAVLARGGQSQSRTLDLRVALQKVFPMSFSLSLDVNSSSGNQGVISATMSEDEVVAIQVFGKDMEGANSFVVRFEYDRGQVVYDRFDAGTVLPNARVTHQQGSTFVEVSLTTSGQATDNSGLVGTIRFRTLRGFSGSAIRLARADLARVRGQSQSRTLNLRIALQKALPTSFSLSLDVNSAGGDQSVTSAVVSAGEGVAIQIFGEDLLGASGVSLRFEYNAAQVVYESFDAGAVLPNAQTTHQQGSAYVEISLTSSGQATVNSGLIGTIRFRTLTGFSGSAIRLVRADLVRGGQTQSAPLNLRVELQVSIFIPPSPDFDGDGGVGISDFLFFVDVFGTQEGQAGYESKYDLDSNGTIGIPDFLIFVDNFGKEVSSPSSGGSGGSGGDATQVAIPDANLRSAIEDALGKARGASINRDEMATLTRLRALNANIRDLTGLEFATSLTELNLQVNSITDISALSALTSLTWLYFDGNSITDVSGLSGLTNLVILGLGENSISDVSDLSGLTSLTALSLSGNNITDVSALSGLTRLRSLILNENNITDMSVLSGLTNLEKLWLFNNNISDWSTLSGLTNLESLNLGSNNISDVSMLSGLIKLTWLYLERNNITDVSALSGLTNLIWLNLYLNAITDVSALSGLTSLNTLNLSHNSISDLAPLVANTGLGNEDVVEVRNNPLSATSINTHIPALQSRGVEVRFSASTLLVAIPDANLRSSIEDALGKASGAPITRAEMSTLTRLSAWQTNTRNLTGLEFATSLTWLNLGDNNISDVSALSGLTNLTFLDLHFNSISDVSALSGLTNLQDLSLRNNSISDVSALSGLTSLTRLALRYNNITDVSALSGLIGLRWLYLHDNRISDLAPLIANTGLGSGDRVFVSGNPLSAISINTHIPALQSRGVDVRFGASKPAVEQQRDISHFDSY